MESRIFLSCRTTKNSTGGLSFKAVEAGEENLSLLLLEFTNLSLGGHKEAQDVEINASEEAGEQEPIEEEEEELTVMYGAHKAKKRKKRKKRKHQYGGERIAMKDGTRYYDVEGYPSTGPTQTDVTQKMW